MKKIDILLTNDVETTSLWHNSLRDKTGFKVYKEGMPLLLDLYEKYNIKTTFYFTGYIAKLIPDIVKMVTKNGHEVASHGMSHLTKNGFDIMPLKKQIKHLKESKKLLEDISGDEVISFRAPALRVNKNTIIALEESQYKIDSSIASQRFDMFMSFGGLKKLNWLFSPRLPYRISKKNIFKKGNSSVIEVPLTAFFIPYVGTTMRIFPKIANIQKRLFELESTITGKPIVFDVHPNEYIDEKDEKREFEIRSTSYLGSILQDHIRSKIKLRNLGLSGFNIYEKHVKYFSIKNHNFYRVKDYVSNINL
tara:strand:- start:152 stop:1072 length:921 start_codon:yes stop_codon:yes gene_type:complete